MSDERTAPYYCPYCGDEELRPHGVGHGEWECRSCRRAFALSFRGLLAGNDEEPLPGSGSGGDGAAP